jgi:hypothetical protein
MRGKQMGWRRSTFLAGERTAREPAGTSRATPFRRIIQGRFFRRCLVHEAHDLSQWTAGELLAQADLIARLRYDGHLSMLRFTTGWKVTFGTPDLDGEGQDEVDELLAYPSLHEALVAVLSLELRDLAPPF